MQPEGMKLALTIPLGNRYAMVGRADRLVATGQKDIPLRLAMSYELNPREVADTPAPVGVGPAERRAERDAIVSQAANPRVSQDSPAATRGKNNLPPDDTPPLRGIQWGLAPIRWGGNVAYETRTQTSQGQPASNSQVIITNVNGSSYIWQPWFAQLTGGLGLVNSSSANSGVSSKSDSVTGNLGLSLLPLSRFPFFAGVDVSDSRTSGVVTANDFRSYRVNLRQSYRPVDGTTNYSATYQRSTLSSSTFGNDTLDVLEGNVTKTFGTQFIEINGNHTHNDAGLSGASSNLDRLNMRHTYRPDLLLSVESLGSVNKADFRQRLNGAGSGAGTRFIQLNTFANWRPNEGTPLQVTGGARFFTLDSQSNGIDSQSRSLGANVGANYDLNRHTRLSGGADVAETTGSSGSVFTTSENGSVVYSPDIVNLGKFNYRWNTAGSIANSTGNEGGSRQTLTGQANQNFLRDFTLGDESRIGFNFGQGYSATYDSASAASQTLSNSAAATWSKAQEAVTTYASLSATDARTFGRNANDFQLINFQATRNTQLNRNSYWAGSLTLQAARQSSPNKPGGGFNTLTSGNLVYQQQRAFGIPRLRYYANLTVSSQQFDSRLSGDINAPRERVSSSFENTLDYTIGRLDMRLTARIAKIDGNRNGLIFFRVNRQFGGF